MLLVGRQEEHPACKKNWVVGCWHGYLSGARCRLAYGPADATAIIVSCFWKIQTGFTFLVPDHPGSPGQRAVKRVCVWVCVNLSPLRPMPLTTQSSAFKLTCRAVITTMYCISRHVNCGLQTHMQAHCTHEWTLSRANTKLTWHSE